MKGRSLVVLSVGGCRNIPFTLINPDFGESTSQACANALVTTGASRPLHSVAPVATIPPCLPLSKQEPRNTF
jgi:hypothetical protein